MFMKMKNHLNVEFVIKPLTKKVAWINIMLLFMKKKRLSKSNLKMDIQGLNIILEKSKKKVSGHKGDIQKVAQFSLEFFTV